MEINKVSNLFELNMSYQKWTIDSTKKKILSSKSLIDKFSILYSKEFNKLPYRLNLLDDLTTNENAHSKFLIRLLQYKPALPPFLNYLMESYSSFEFDIELINEPILTWEKMRIDGLIKESRKYAIIIENKIHNAEEQEHQIGRYIEKCKSIGFRVNQIFILYLTKIDKDSHSDQTWGKLYTLENFEKRYLKLSYESNILPWLNIYLKTLSPSEILIKSAIVQYIDHLQHFFNQKEIYSNMNSELQNFLSAELNLNLDKAENVEVVINRIAELNELSLHLKELAKVSKLELFKDWESKILKDFNFEESKVFCYEHPSFIKTGVNLNFNGNSFSILIEHNSNSTYFGFGRHSASEFLTEEVREFLSSLIKDEALKPDEPWWYGWKYTDFRNGYGDFAVLLRAVLSKLENTK